MSTKTKSQQVPAQPRWESVASKEQFSSLLRRKRQFVLPATVFFIVYYFALPVLVGYFPEFMSRQVIGPVNLAYLFALSQFVMAWVVAWLYFRAAERFDEMAKELRIGEENSPASTPASKPAPKPVSKKETS